MGKQTALYAKHLEARGKIVDFGGWDMPIHYGSQIQEHHAVRTAVGMFDVSHMTIVDMRGIDATAYLQKLLANDVAKLQEVGKALYSGMLNQSGGVIDDVIVYNMGGWYRMVSNCATREKDLEWMTAQTKGFEVTLTERPELAIIAVQGPKAIVTVKTLRSDAAELIHSLIVFQGLPKANWFYARTGYTGEEGLEVILPEEDAPTFWQALLDAGVAPCGLAARDTLRLEAGMNLYGNEMDESVSPLRAGMGWTIAWQPVSRHFIGREALEAEKAQGIAMKQVGLVLESKGVMRAHQKVLVDGVGEGEITSGTFSPSLDYSIAIARVPATTGDSALVDIRGKLLPVKVIKLPFVRNGQKQF
ncbi:MAG: hypothetical protein RL217_1508 [Pseudomonadota bacterium]|jgi:aminomethyltransferase